MEAIDYGICSVVNANMAEDEEVRSLFSQGLETFTSKEVANVLATEGFTPEQCRVLEGKLLSHFIFVRRSVFPPKFLSVLKLKSKFLPDYSSLSMWKIFAYRFVKGLQLFRISAHVA